MVGERPMAHVAPKHKRSKTLPTMPFPVHHHKGRGEHHRKYQKQHYREQYLVGSGGKRNFSAPGRLAISVPAASVHPILP
jgi:hypothetical protein